jgi:oxaloacetate decarboxylase alpha subunit/pyruvate carboxylase subunit B
MSHLKAIEAGVDIIDTCMTPYAYRTSHAAIEPLVMTLLGTSRDTGFDIRKLAEINVILEKEVLPKYKHLLDDSKVSIIDINVLLHQTPGGMLSNLVNQLREMDALDKIDAVYEELPKVRKDLGQIPLVTPTSQIVGIQTVNNVLFDTPEERYKMITGQVKDLCYGLYGKTAVPINEEVQKKALKGYDRGEEPITCRPAEVLEPELDKAKEEIGDLAVDMDDLVLYAIYPVTGKKFLQWKYGKEEPPAEVQPTSLETALAKEELVKLARKGEVVPKSKLAEQPEKSENTRTFNVFIDDEVIEVGVDEVGGSPVLNYIQAGGAIAAAPAGAPATPAAPAGPVPAAPKPAAPAPAAPAPAAEAPKAAAPAPAAAADADGTPLTAPMPGMIVKYEKEVGDSVEKGETVLILEAMKMENALPAPVSGTIKAVNFGSGDSVAKNAVLAVIG